MKILLFLLLVPFELFAQDITGVWSGRMYNDTTGESIQYELAISGDHGKLSGYAHSVFIIKGVENIGLKSVKIKKTSTGYRLEDNKLLYNNYSQPPPKGVRVFSVLTLSVKDSTLVLSGPWTTNVTRNYKRVTGTLLLQKKRDLQDDPLIAGLKDLDLANSLSFMPAQEPERVLAGRARSAEPIHGVVTPQLRDSAGSIAEGVSKDNTARSMQTRRQTPSGKALEVPQHRSDTMVVNSKKGSTQNISSQKQSIPPAENTQEAKKGDITKEGFTALVMRPSEVSTVKSITAARSSSGDFAGRSGRVQVPAPKAAAEIQERKIQTINSVDIKGDSLLLTLYDNGVVDGDTVSVLLNGKVIMPRVGLSLQPINKTIYLTPEMGDSLQLIMYAENLGSIPPNTGLLIVHDGNDAHYINFSGDLHRNAAIILRRKRK